MKISFTKPNINPLVILFLLSCFNACFISYAHAVLPIDSLTESKPKVTQFIVEKVISADTIELKNRNKIRLIGLNAPQPPKRQVVERDVYGMVIEKVNPQEPLEEQAYKFAKSLMEGQTVRLEYDLETKDEHFNTFAYVFLTDGTFVNEEILRQGFANLKIILPNTKYADKLRAAYQEAREEKRGLQGE